jgi:peptidoglycan/xylan/chitin deacetylase (PgdA/CDA1 family)
MERRKSILLSFDLEEFDMPLEYKRSILFPDQLKASDEGMAALMPVLEKHDIPATFFTTANYAQHRKDLVKQLAQKHEIASHTFYHSLFDDAHLATSRQVLEAISGTEVVGLRMPRMRPVSMAAVKAAGYQYDSSINPTWLPGRYNNLHLPRKVYEQQGVPRLPASVTPILRIPLFWLLFKNIPLNYYAKLAIRTLRHDGHLCLYFHPWEFIDLASYGMPRYTHATDGTALVERLDQLIELLKEEGTFRQTKEYMQAFYTPLAAV